MTNADTWTVDTWDNSILCIGRYYEGEKIYGLFNFSEYDKTAWINERDGIYKDLITGQEMDVYNSACYGQLIQHTYYAEVIDRPLSRRK